jgi:hypothetical protein
LAARQLTGRLSQARDRYRAAPGHGPDALLLHKLRIGRRSFVVERIASLRRASHRQSFLESFDDCDHRLHECEPIPANRCWSRNGEYGRASLVRASHLSSPSGVETTLGCASADRAVVASPEDCGPRGRALDTPMPPPDFRCVGTRHFANSPWPGERARCSTWAKCLG